MRSARVVLLLVGVALLGGAYWYFRIRGKAAAAAAATATAATGDKAIPVLAAPVVRKDMPVYLSGLGSVAAFNTVLIRPQVDGRLDRVAFTEGQAVKQGDLLAQIDPRPFNIQLHSAQAALARDDVNLRNARVNLDRYDTLSKQNLIPIQQVTDQKAMVDSLAATLAADQAAIDTARLSLTFARVTSPIDGVTGIRMVDVGNLVHASDPTGLVLVTQLDPIAVFFTLPEDTLPQVAREMAAGTLTVEALSRDGKTTLGTGKVALVDNQINTATGTIRLKAVFPNPSHSLWPNQFVKARLLVATRKGALVVPAPVIQRGPQGTFAYLIGKDDKVSMAPIDVDAIDGDVAIVSKGLEEGQMVVTDNQYQLAPGKRVTTKPAEKAGDHPAGVGAPASSGTPAAGPKGGPGPRASGAPSPTGASP